MQEPAIPLDEARRIASLHALNILDTSTEERFDRITRIAQHVFAVPIAVVSLVDSNRQWFKSCQGLDVRETPRNISFCGHAILGSEVFIVEDALLDARFADNPLVTGAPHIRFYAGQPLRTRNGSQLGTLCVIDFKPRHLSDAELKILRDLAAMVEQEIDVMDTHKANMALHDNENRLRAILDNVIDGIITISEQGIVESFNFAAEQIFGYSADEVIGNNVNMLMPEPYHGQHDSYLHNYATTGNKKIIGIGREVTGRRKDGSTFPMDLAVSEMKIGDMRMFTGIVRDLSQRQQAEKLLAVTRHDNENRLRAILDNVIDGIITINEQGVVESFNYAAEQIFGYSADEVIGNNVNMLMPEPYHGQHDGYLHNYATTGNKKIIGIGREVTGRRKSGSTFPMDLAVSEMSIGEKRMFTGIVRDITEHKKEERLQAQLSAIIESSTDAVMSKSLEGIITSWNPAAEKMFGYSEHEMIGQPMTVIIPKELANEERLILEKIRLGEYIEHFETKRRRKNGDLFPISLTISPIKDKAGTIIGASNIARDVSERMRVERMKTEFISTVSHELRTPLTSIRGALGLIAGGVVGELPAQAKALVDIAHKNSERLILLVNDILDMEKIASGKMNFNLRPVEIVPLIEQALEANRAYAEQFNVSYALEHTTNIPPVQIDVDRFMQVLANFLSNAAKFSPAGGVVTVAVLANHQHVRVSVSDRGQGIPEEFRSKIFQKFSQADSSDTRTKGGTGLGLSITKALVEGMGGEIGFSSERGVGTTFFADFPAKPGQEAGVAGASASRKRILICEDNRDVARLLQLVLEKGGYDSDIAYSADEAKKCLSMADYRAITLDILIPGQDGFSLLRELQNDAATRAIPVIVISAKAGEPGNEMESGIVVLDWISKPIDETRVLAALQRISGSGDNKPVILHVEDDEDIRQVVMALIGNEGVVIAASSLAEAKRNMLSAHVDLIILDLGLPDGTGLDLLPFLNEKALDTPVIIFSATELSTDVAKQVKAALVKSRTTNEQLLARIKQII